MTLTGCPLRDNPLGGVQLFGAGSFQLSSNIIQGNEGSANGNGTRYGDAVSTGSGVSAWDSDKRLETRPQPVPPLPVNRPSLPPPHTSPLRRAKALVEMALDDAIESPP